MRDVAARAGASLKTVSRVVNGDDGVSAELSARVRGAIRDLGYRRNASARHLRIGATAMTSAFIGRDLLNPFYSSIAAAIEQQLDRHGQLLTIGNSRGDAARQEEVLERIAGYDPGGLILSPLTDFDASSLSSPVQQIPRVLLDVGEGTIGEDHVRLDNHGSLYRATTSAVELGYRSFGILSQSYHLPTMKYRVQGCLDALSEGGTATQCTFAKTGLDSESRARKFALDVLAAQNPPDVIVCTNNITARGALRALRESSMQAMLIVFDRLPFAELLGIPMIQISYDIERLGAAAADLLVWRLNHPDGAPKGIVVPTEIEFINMEDVHGADIQT